MLRLCGGAAFTLGSVVVPMRSHAQALGVAQGADLPAWLDRWSPLIDRADLPRRLPSAGPALLRLAWPAPQLGLFWQAGNPAGLPDDVPNVRTDLWAVVAHQQGQFRRPLDPVAAKLEQLSAIAWQPFGARGAGLGRVTFDQETFDPGTQANGAEAFGSSPFVVTDTSTTPVRRTRARLEGAGGWRLGRWAVGAALGYDTRDHATVRAGFVRRARRTMPGATLGMARALGSAVSPVRIGAHVGWRGSAETVNLNERAVEGRVYQLEGYREARPIDVLGFYYRRMQMSEAAAGVQAAGTLARTLWIVFVDAARREQRLWRQQQNDPATDRWKAEAWGAGMSLQRAFAGEEWLVTASGQWRTLAGDADLALDSAGTIFTADERVSLGSVEVRWTPIGPWRALASVSVAGERRERRDSTAGIDTDLESRTPLVALEVARRVTSKLELLAGVSLGRYQARGFIPQPAARGPLYRRLLAPEVQLYSTESTPQSIALSARLRVGGGTTLWAIARSETLTGAPPRTAFSASGNRRATSVAIGASR